MKTLVISCKERGWMIWKGNYWPLFTLQNFVSRITSTLESTFGRNACLKNPVLVYMDFSTDQSLVVVPLSLLIETTSLVSTDRINLLCLRPSSDETVFFAKEFLNLPNLIMLKKEVYHLLHISFLQILIIEKSVLKKGKSAISSPAISSSLLILLRLSFASF